MEKLTAAQLIKEIEQVLTRKITKYGTVTLTHHNVSLENFHAALKHLAPRYRCEHFRPNGEPGERNYFSTTYKNGTNEVTLFSVSISSTASFYEKQMDIYREVIAELEKRKAEAQQEFTNEVNTATAIKEEFTINQ